MSGERKRKAPAESGRRGRAKAAYLEGILSDPVASGERKAFFSDLSLFYRRRWTVPLRAPSVAGTNVDLFQLYQRVSKLGGWLKVRLLFGSAFVFPFR